MDGRRGRGAEGRMYGRKKGWTDGLTDGPNNRKNGECVLARGRASARPRVTFFFKEGGASELRKRDIREPQILPSEKEVGGARFDGGGGRG